MVYQPPVPRTFNLIIVVVCVCIAVLFGPFFRDLLRVWLSDPEFSFGILIPVIVAYLLWSRRQLLKNLVSNSYLPGLGIASLGCLLLVLGSLGASLLLTGVAFILVLEGTAAFLFGVKVLRAIGGRLALLILMVPLPSYVVGQLAWRLQSMASTISGGILRLFGIPVLQDGNILKLPDYVLEVKQACSGSRSIFALLALAIFLGLNLERKWLVRCVLVITAPILAVGANVIRIVGTGVIARNWGALAANESLHAAWGMVVFVLAVSGLVAIRKAMRWATESHS